MDGFSHKLGVLAARVFKALATPQVCDHHGGTAGVLTEVFAIG
jgi:hypothetical protein